MTGVMTPPARSRATDPETSVQAEPEPFVASLMHQIVLDLFENYGPMTDYELNERYAQLSEVYADWPRARFDTPRKRRSELSGRRLLVDTDGRRSNPWGRREVVWAIPQEVTV